MTFDEHAATYDAVAQSTLGRVLRERVYAVVEPLLGKGTSVIDLGCGTGIDTAWLADRTERVLAVDPSPEMVALTQQRCAHLGNVECVVGTASDLVDRTPANLMLANFGALNCAGPIATLGPMLASLVAPGGWLVATIMPATCPIEWAVGAATRNTELRTRRTSPQVAVDGYADLEVRYFTPKALASALDGFELVHTESLGLILPPFEQRAWVEERPRLLGALAAADRRLGALGARLGWGDHVIAVLKRVST